MDFWNELEIILEMDTKIWESTTLENAIKYLIPYLKKMARSAQFRARMTGVYIPFEDFYSMYLISVWKVLEDLHAEVFDIKKIKHIVAYRLKIAEKDVWRTYKKKSNSATDINGTTYEATRWKSLECTLLDSMCEDFNDISLIFKELFLKYSQKEPAETYFFLLLIQGYSTSEAAKIAFGEKEYTNKVRKKIERSRKKLKNYLYEEKILIR